MTQTQSRTVRFLASAMGIAIVVLAASSAYAATITTSTTAPPVNGADIASVPGATSPWSKYWIWDGDVPGQTFTIGSEDVELNAITLRVWETSGTVPTKTHELTIGEVSGNTFTSVLSVEQALQDTAAGPWNADDYVTFWLDNPVPMSANTTYGFDLVMTADNAGWGAGIPYLHAGDNLYPDGQRFSGGSRPTQHISPFNWQRGDLVFHLDMETVTAESTIIPEPATFALLGLGVLGLLIRRKK